MNKQLTIEELRTDPELFEDAKRLLTAARGCTLEQIQLIVQMLEVLKDNPDDDHLRDCLSECKNFAELKTILESFDK